MKWTTRERPKIDRIACPSLLKNFVDGEAKFIYVPIIPFVIPIFLLASDHLSAQEAERPELAAGILTEQIRLDGRLDETDWQNTPFTADLHTTVPLEIGTPSGSTEIRVLTNEKSLLIGILCADAEPSGIVRCRRAWATQR